MLKRPKPRPGKRPLNKKAEPPVDPQLEAARKTLPPWMTEEPKVEELPKPPKVISPLTALQRARAKVEKLAAVARSDAFDDWVSVCAPKAKEPNEWTQARVLYESYLKHARTYGQNRPEKRLAVEVLATETQWGRMMATLFHKKRRTAGWFYPLRVKRGA